MDSIAKLSQVAAPKTRRGQATLEKILLAAESEFAEKGFHDGSISGIAHRAGIGQGTFYLYFKCKEDVLRELVLFINRSLRALLSEAIIDVSDRIDAERIGLRTFLEYIQAHPGLYRILQESQFVDPEVYRAYYESFAQGYNDALMAAQQRGGIRDGDTEAWTWSMMGMMHFIGQRFVVWDTERTLDDIVDSTIDLLSHGLKP
ncbi:TetR/AcrR family transcriptional regulator [Reinekea blandensis]|uniref:Regulatory protein, TetR n=1 Tax=Reinekea blandensis MED297 TaxID=314283 RepID=A4BDV8_9GAMM|nr:TetR/AcrR family transcriptional regulator [Reinekea blandensis]EAR09717.1 regulatory protein, TetR [Reinekea blandensis MED297]